MAPDPRLVAALRIDHYRVECATLGVAVVQRLVEGSLPAADAYAWGRILGHMARKALSAEGRTV